METIKYTVWVIISFVLLSACTDGGSESASAPQEPEMAVESLLQSTSAQLTSNAATEYALRNSQISNSILNPISTTSGNDSFSEENVVGKQAISQFRLEDISIQSGLQRLLIARYQSVDYFASWSLGKGWRSSIDSRVIFGSKYLAAQEYDHLKQKTDEMQSMINDIQYHPDKSSLQQQLNALKALLPGLLLAKTKALSAEAKNIYVVDQNDEEAKKEQWIGNDLIKWIDIKGQTFIFKIQSDNSIVPEGKHANRFSILNDGRYKVMGEDNIEYVYTSQGLILSSTDRQGNAINYNRDSNHRPIEISGPYGRIITFQWSNTGLLEKVTDPLNRSVEYAYDNQMRLIKVTNPAGFETEYTYTYSENPKAITVITDAEGNETKYTYQKIDHAKLGSQTVIKSVIDPVGEQSNFEYDTQIYKTKVVNRNNAATHLESNDDFLLSKIINPDGTTTTWEYDSNGKPVKETNELGESRQFTYNANGKLTSMTQPDGTSINLSVNQWGDPLVITDPLGNFTHITRDGFGNPIKILYPDGKFISMTWNDKGLLTQKIDRDSNTTTWDYNEFGRPIEQTNPDGSSRNMSWDIVGRLLSSEDELGHITTFTYNELDSLVESTDALGRKTIFEYSPNQNLIKTTKHNGLQTEFVYNHRNNRTKQIDTYGRITEFIYDPEEQINRIIKPGGIEIQYTYDSRERLIKSEILGSDVKKTFAYDVAGRKLTETDGTGSIKTWGYNAIGTINSFTNAIGGVTQFQYNSKGERITATDPLGYQTTWERDSSGRFIAITDKNGNQQTFIRNGNGQIISKIDKKGGTWTYQRNYQGKTTSKTDPLGNEYKYSYDPKGRLVSETNPLGATTELKYDAIDRVIEVKEPNGLITSIIYTDYENGFKVDTDRGGRKESRRFDLLGRLVASTDAIGQTWFYSYGSNGLLSAVANPEGNAKSFFYNNAGQLVKTVDELGRETQFEPDANGNYLSETKPTGAIWKYVYNGLGLVTSIEKPDGGETTFTYDLQGQLIGKTDPLSRNETWEYDGFGNVLSWTNRAGHKYLYVYDPQNELVSMTNPLGQKTIIKRDTIGNIQEVINPLGNSLSFERNAIGQVLASIDALNNKTIYQRNHLGWLTKTINPSNAAISNTYNEFGERVETTNPLGDRTKFLYDPLGRLFKTIDAMGSVKTRAYNFRNKVVEKTDALGRVTKHEFDAAGNLIAVVDPLNNKTQYAWDGENRLVQVTDALGRNRHYLRDSVGRLVKSINPMGISTHYQYDLADQLVKRINPDGKGIDYSYDPMGRMLSRSFDGNTESTSFDAAGNRDSISSPGFSESYTYDAAGNLVNLHNTAINRAVSFGYDANNRVISRLDPTNQKTIHYERDNLGQVNKVLKGQQLLAELEWNELGQLIKRTLSNGTRDLKYYDSLGRMVGIARQTQSKGDDDDEDDDDWDDDSADDDDDWEDDDDDDLSPLNGPFPSDRFVFSKLGKKPTSGMAHSVRDLRRAVKESGWHTSQLYAYFYDFVDNVKGRYRFNKYNRFDYDANDRLIAEYKSSSSKSEKSYTYDAVGNRTYQKNKSRESFYTYNELDQLVMEKGWRTVRKANKKGDLSKGSLKNVDIINSYDLNGNLTSTSWANYLKSLKHDSVGRMTAVGISYTDGNDWLSRDYSYDFLDRRISRTHKEYGIPDVTFNTLYIGRQTIAEFDQNRDPIRSMVSRPKGLYGELIHQTLYKVPGSQLIPKGDDDDDDEDSSLHRRIEKAASLWFHHNHLGSVSELTDSKGRTYDRYLYSTFGKVENKTGDDDDWDDWNDDDDWDDEGPKYAKWSKYIDNIINPYRFLSKETDVSTGFTQLDARSYNPDIGRFIQPDVYNFSNLGLPENSRPLLLTNLGFNIEQLISDPRQQLKYTYVSNNPLRWIDPMGLSLGKAWFHDMQWLDQSKLSWTAAIGVSVTGGAVKGGTVGKGVVTTWDGPKQTGQWGTYTTTGTGDYYGAGEARTIDLTLSSNGNLEQFEGDSVTSGGSGNIKKANVGLEVSYPKAMIEGEDVAPYVTVNLGWGSSIFKGGNFLPKGLVGAEFHVLKTNTQVVDHTESVKKAFNSFVNGLKTIGDFISNALSLDHLFAPSPDNDEGDDKDGGTGSGGGQHWDDIPDQPCPSC